MSTLIQRRRGTTVQHSTFTGAVGEVTVDTTKNTVVVHDGSTAGGFPIPTATDLALKAPLASPTLTGTPAAPTASVDTNTTQIATTAMVLAQAASATPAAVGTAAVGTSTRYARGDHAHAATGRYLGTTVLTVGSGNLTTGASTNTIKVRLQGAGASGGGGAAGGTGSAAGGGGGAGGYAEKTFTVSPSTAYAYVVGAGGAAPAAGNNPGNDGNASTFTVGATTVTAQGGKAGGGSLNKTTNQAIAGGAPAPISTNGDVNGSGQPRDAGRTLAAAVSCSGAGGSSAFGGGGVSGIGQTAGNAGVGYGSGGSGGGVVSGGAATAGALGQDGIIVVDEYS